MRDTRGNESWISRSRGKRDDGFGQRDKPWSTHAWVSAYGCASQPCAKVWAGLCARGVGVTKPARSWLIIFAIALPGSQRTGYLVLLRNLSSFQQRSWSQSSVRNNCAGFYF